MLKKTLLATAAAGMIAVGTLATAGAASAAPKAPTPRTTVAASITARTAASSLAAPTGTSSSTPVRSSIPEEGLPAGVQAGEVVGPLRPSALEAGRGWPEVLLRQAAPPRRPELGRRLQLSRPVLVLFRRESRPGFPPGLFHAGAAASARLARTSFSFRPLRKASSSSCAMRWSRWRSCRSPWASKAR